jgi:hypothetical protein
MGQVPLSFFFRDDFDNVADLAVEDLADA